MNIFCLIWIFLNFCLCFKISYESGLLKFHSTALLGGTYQPLRIGVHCFFQRPSNQCFSLCKVEAKQRENCHFYGFELPKFIQKGSEFSIICSTFTCATDLWNPKIFILKWICLQKLNFIAIFVIEVVLLGNCK